MKYITKTSGPGAYEVGPNIGRSMGYQGVGLLPSWLGGSGAATDSTGTETVALPTTTGSSLLDSIVGVFGSAGQAAASALPSTPQSSTWGYSWGGAPTPAATSAGPSTFDKILGAGKDVGVSLLNNFLNKSPQAQQVAVAQGTNYTPYLLLGGAAIAAVILLKRKKESK